MAAPPPDYIQNPHELYTPVDGNTVFGPDSYSTGSATGRHTDYPPTSQSQPELGVPPGYHVREHTHANPQRENARSQSRSRTTTHEAHEDQAPQIPPLDFSYPSSLPSNQDLTLGHDDSSYRASRQPYQPTARAISDFTLSQPRSVLYDPSIQAELSAVKSPVENVHSGQSAPDLHGGLLQPRLNASYRVSTDYTWRPGLKPGAFI